MQIYLINSFAPLRDRFVNYGARSTSYSQSSPRCSVQPRRQSLLGRTMDWLASWSVPHAWFLHFYLASVCASAVWALVYFKSASSTLRVDRSLLDASEAQMTPAQVTLAWLLMLVQGSRRLWESVQFQKASTSRMWFGHWALGIIFYAMMSVAIWIEGTGRQTCPTAVSESANRDLTQRQ